MSIIGKSFGILIESVIFATDFSPASKGAAIYASNLAVYFHLNLIVTHCFSLSQAALEVEVETGKHRSKQRTDLENLLKNTALVLPSGEGKSEAILLEGDPHEVVPALAYERSPALVVLGTHGRNAVDRLLLGSVAESILRRFNGPALTVGPHVSAVLSKQLSFRRILYATDGYPESVHAAPFAVAFAEAYGIEIDVLHVVRSDQIDHPDRLHEIQQRFYSALDATVPLHAKEFCDPRSFVEVGEAQDRILKHIDERKIDLLVLGLKRNSHFGMENRTKGAFPIIAMASCAVLTIADGSI
ncbi:universal stress protein [Edaphobacter albus]|uniref:universal stress protein n=1 Tax=Edaphobacter sp. 4G125 TaxID=2763071 RepID=UPI0016495831|nr:universal stress protein [Edaphobacter sp. 4G125]QNI35677.1 universal stress protein [Edaphobacter sp. 4G125]